MICDCDSNVRSKERLRCLYALVSICSFSKDLEYVVIMIDSDDEFEK
jgi:hypothetical protein